MTGYEKNEAAWAIFRDDPGASEPHDLWLVLEGSEEDARIAAEDEARTELRNYSDGFATKPLHKTPAEHLRDFYGVSYVVAQTTVVTLARGK